MEEAEGRPLHKTVGAVNAIARGTAVLFGLGIQRTGGRGVRMHKVEYRTLSPIPVFRLQETDDPRDGRERAPVPCGEKGDFLEVFHPDSDFLNRVFLCHGFS